MPKLRKMLGNIDSPECIALMRLIESQSEKTLAAWAVDYAQKYYLRIYASYFPEDGRLAAAISASQAYLNGSLKRSELMSIVKQAGQIARDTADNPIAQAAARAIYTACAAVQRPTNTLGFLFYGAAATAYNQVGLMQNPKIYHGLAAQEFNHALHSLQQVCVPNEPNPVKINWNC